MPITPASLQTNAMLDPGLGFAAGMAFDHEQLPKIVAVHTLGKHNTLSSDQDPLQASHKDRVPGFWCRDSSRNHPTQWPSSNRTNHFEAQDQIQTLGVQSVVAKENGCIEPSRSGTAPRIPDTLDNSMTGLEEHGTLGYNAQVTEPEKVACISNEGPTNRKAKAFKQYVIWEPLSKGVTHESPLKSSRSRSSRTGSQDNLCQSPVLYRVKKEPPDCYPNQFASGQNVFQSPLEIDCENKSCATNVFKSGMANSGMISNAQSNTGGIADILVRAIKQDPDDKISDCEISLSIDEDIQQRQLDDTYQMTVKQKPVEDIPTPPLISRAIQYVRYTAIQDPLSDSRCQRKVQREDEYPTFSITRDPPRCLQNVSRASMVPRTYWCGLHCQPDGQIPYDAQYVSGTVDGASAIEYSARVPNSQWPGSRNLVESSLLMRNRYNWGLPKRGLKEKLALIPMHDTRSLASQIPPDYLTFSSKSSVHQSELHASDRHQTPGSTQMSDIRWLEGEISDNHADILMDGDPVMPIVRTKKSTWYPFEATQLNSKDNNTMTGCFNDHQCSNCSDKPLKNCIVNLGSMHQDTILSDTETTKLDIQTSEIEMSDNIQLSHRMSSDHDSDEFSWKFYELQNTGWSLSAEGGADFNSGEGDVELAEPKEGRTLKPLTAKIVDDESSEGSNRFRDVSSKEKHRHVLQVGGKSRTTPPKVDKSIYDQTLSSRLASNKAKLKDLKTLRKLKRRYQTEGTKSASVDGNRDRAMASGSKTVTVEPMKSKHHGTSSSKQNTERKSMQASLDVANRCDKKQSKKLERNAPDLAMEKEQRKWKEIQRREEENKRRQKERLSKAFKTTISNVPVQSNNIRSSSASCSKYTNNVDQKKRSSIIQLPNASRSSNVCRVKPLQASNNDQLKQQRKRPGSNLSLENQTPKKNIKRTTKVKNIFQLFGKIYTANQKAKK